MKSLGGALLAIAAVISALSTSAVAAQDGAFIASDGLKLHYLEAGSGRAVVFMPGWMLPASIWSRQLTRFSADHRVIALDPRFQGDSQEAPNEQPHENGETRRARDIGELIDRLGLDHPIVVAWSNAVGELLTLIDREGSSRLGGIVLVDGAVKLPANFLEQVAPELDAFRANRLDKTETFVRSLFVKPLGADELKMLLSNALKMPTDRAIEAVKDQAETLDFTPMLGKITVPVMVVFNKGFDGHAAIIKQNIPSARLERFEGTGHALFVDDPVRFDRLLAEFLSAAEELNRRR